MTSHALCKPSLWKIIELHIEDSFKRILLNLLIGNFLQLELAAKLLIVRLPS